MRGGDETFPVRLNIVILGRRKKENLPQHSNENKQNIRKTETEFMNHLSPFTYRKKPSLKGHLQITNHSAATRPHLLAY